MRLINASTKELETFHNAESRPRYAILSHRWIGDDEVTFEDMQRTHRKWMPAWPKITMCCQQALADGLNYAWVDTCCIDKNSSAELSEAINSMYAWYSDAAVCYAYLNDVECAPYDQLDISLSAHPPMPAEVIQEIIASDWFTRAWTLQELIAPSRVVFYDAKFRHLGSKADYAAEIEQRFAIPTEVLINPYRLWEYPVAVRMSWAAHRRATRTEDIAYSLFGVFGVNLPLLYGEGTRSFERLEEEIIRQVHDHSIFVWSSKRDRKRKQPNDDSSIQLPLLASSPADFEDCRDMTLTVDSGDIRPYSLTNVGLDIELRIFPYDLDVYVGLLNCKSRSSGCSYGLLIARRGDKATTWHRVKAKESDFVRINHPEKLKNSVWQKMYIVKDRFRTHDNQRHLHQTHSGHHHLPFYGININAPAFLAGYAGGRRPYALIAHHDWDMAFRVLEDNGDNKYLQPGYTANIDARLTPSSHIGLAMSIDQTLRLTGFRRSTRRKLNEENQGIARNARGDTEQPPEQIGRKESQAHSNATSLPNHKIALGVLAMPLMSTGTAGMIMFDHPVHGVRAIKAGFDFDFRPVVFIVTHQAEVEPQIQIWMQERRYTSIGLFETRCNMLDSHGEDRIQRVWTIGPEHLRHSENFTTCEDGSILVSKGVYAFVNKVQAEPAHWVFKPYEGQHWHLALSLEKRRNDGLEYWEFMMDKRDDLVKLEFDLVS